MSVPFRPFPGKSGPCRQRICPAAHNFYSASVELCGRTFGQLATLVWKRRGRGIEGGEGRWRGGEGTERDLLINRHRPRQIGLVFNKVILFVDPFLL
jgi:hypothetical protein